MILVLNCGSQSFKWKLFNPDLSLEKSGKAEILNSKEYGRILEEEIERIASFDVVVNLVGHRVVHGGNIFAKPARISPENIKDLEEINYLAPLHNPYEILGIKACHKLFPGRPNVAVFDTQFFAGLPDFSATYALPGDLVEKFCFKRYGFHGTSHEYVAKKAAEKIKKPFNKLKIISCHLGGGSSVSAIKNGKAMDVSMGFTPLEGLVMTTRSGSIDPGIVLNISKEFGADKASEILNKHSGIKGICGESEMLKVLELIKMGDKKAKLAFDIFIYSIKKYIGAYFAVMGGCDVLVFTGAIGAGDPKTRNAVCKDLDMLKKTKTLVIPTDEELAIAKKILSI